MQWRGVLSWLCVPVMTGCATVHYPRLTDAGGCAIERVAVQDGRAQFQFNGLSPDGRTLAVGWEQAGQHGAYLLDLRSGAPTPLPSPFDNAVSFSPDGQRLISAARTADRRTEIVELVLATGAIRTIASDPAAEFLPSYSRDLSRVYFNSYRSGSSDVYVVQLSTGALTRLTTFDGYDAHAQISPDGTRLAFHREVTKGNYEVVVLDLASGAERVLAAAPGEDAYPAWSPDGRHLVFSSDRASVPGRLDLFVMRDDGDDLRQLTRGGNDSYATWTANGREVYFVSRREGHGVYRLHLDAAQRCRPSVPRP